MRIYNKYILPRLINSTCKQKSYLKQRKKIVPYARGRVLEIGFGSGLNLPFYNTSKIKYIIGLDNSANFWQEKYFKTKKNEGSNFRLITGSAENIPFKANSFDSVVTTYTLCSIKNIKKALEEINRVLDINGNLIFCEHGLSPSKSIQKWQYKLNSFWQFFTGGCNLTRDIPSILSNNNFKIIEMETNYIPTWKLVSFNYLGRAELRNKVEVNKTEQPSA